MAQNNNEGMKQLIADLNKDLASEYNAIIGYLTYSAKVKGRTVRSWSLSCRAKSLTSRCTPSTWPTRSLLSLGSHCGTEAGEAERRCWRDA